MHSYRPVDSSGTPALDICLQFETYTETFWTEEKLHIKKNVNYMASMGMEF